MNASTPLHLVFRAAALLAINLLFLMVWGFTGVRKLIDGPPSWFPQKFGGTILAKFPGLAGTFWILALGETLAFALAAAALLRGEFLGGASQRCYRRCSSGACFSLCNSDLVSGSRPSSTRRNNSLCISAER